MSEEKIINDNVMSNDELEEVAGGYGSEIKDDKARFAQLGINITSSKNDERQLKQAFARFGIKMETYHGSITPNAYSRNGHSISREQAWNYIYGHR